MRKSVNNIYKIPVEGRATESRSPRHTDGSLFWPSMSSDGKVIVYEDNFGIWKLDVASGKTNEIKLDIASDEKENEVELETVTNEVDAFDLSPSGRRAVISARGQIFTIATDRGDITRVAPDKMASRNQSPKWSDDGKSLAFVSDRSGRDEIWISDPEGQNPEEDHRSRQREGRARVDAGFDGAALHRRRQEALQLQRRRRQNGGRRLERGRPHRLGCRLSRQQVDCVLEAGSHAAVPRLHRAHRRRRRAAHLGRQPALFREQRRLDGRRPLSRLHLVRRDVSSGIASQGGINTTMALWALSLRDQDRDPTNRDIDNEAQGLAAEAAARQNTGRRRRCRGSDAARRGAHRLERPGAPGAAALGARARPSAA